MMSPFRDRLETISLYALFLALWAAAAAFVITERM